MTRENAGLAGDSGKKSALLTTATGLILRESPKEDPRADFPQGAKGPGGGYTREGVARFLAAVWEHVACLEEILEMSREGVAPSPNTILVRRVVKENYVKLEVILRPGKPRKGQQGWLDLVQRVEAELAAVRRALGVVPESKGESRKHDMNQASARRLRRK